jgi:hypothetical protein
MKILLVPWMSSTLGPFATMVFPGSAEEFHRKQNLLSISIKSILITGRNRHRIVTALLNRYPARIVEVDPFNTGRNTRIGVELDIPDEDALRLLRAFKRLSLTETRSIKQTDVEKLTANPEIEALENYLAVKVLCEE